MVTKVALPMLAEKVVKTADITDGILTLRFSDGTEKTMAIGTSGGGGESGPIVGKSGTLVGAVSMADATQLDIPRATSDPMSITSPAVQMTVEVKEPGNYYAIAFVNGAGCHESKNGEVVTATYSGKSWTYNTRNTAVIMRIDMDANMNDRFFQSDFVVPASYGASSSHSRLFTNVQVGLHTFRFGIYQFPQEDQAAYRNATLAIFRV